METKKLDLKELQKIEGGETCEQSWAGLKRALKADSYVRVAAWLQAIVDNC